MFIIIANLLKMSDKTNTMFEFLGCGHKNHQKCPLKGTGFYYTQTTITKS